MKILHTAFTLALIFAFLASPLNCQSADEDEV